MPTDDPRRPERQTSRVAVEFELDHDGPAETAMRHMLIELEVIASRYGAAIVGSWISSVRPITGEDAPEEGQ